MTDTLETPRVLTVDTDQRWLGAIQKRLTERKIGFGQAEDADDAIEKLNSGDFTAVIMGGLRGGWGTIVDEAVRLDVRPILLSRSTTTVHKAEAQGATAFHKSRVLTKEGTDPIIQAAIRPE